MEEIWWEDTDKNQESQLKNENIDMTCLRRTHIIPSLLKLSPPPLSKNLSSYPPRSSEAHWRGSCLSADQFSLWSAELDEIKESENVLKAKLFPSRLPSLLLWRLFFSPSSLLCCWGCTSGLLGVFASTAGDRDWPPCKLLLLHLLRAWVRSHIPGFYCQILWVSHCLLVTKFLLNQSLESSPKWRPL